MRSNITSIFMYAYESSTLTAELQRRIQAAVNLQQCQNYGTISLISHPSKVMLKVRLNRLKPHAEKIIAEEKAGFRAGMSTTEQICNLRILCEKYLQRQQDLYHVFIDFKKAFDRALACSFVGNHEEVQHQHKPYPSHQKPL